MRTDRFLIVAVFTALVIFVQACNLPAGQPSTQPDLAATITAQAVALQDAAQTATAAAVPVTGNTGSTGNSGAVQVTVSSVTNCRTGPSNAYDLVFTMNPGFTAQVVGKFTPANYWIINNPAGGVCWLWGQYASVTGNTNGLPEYPAPPAPAAPPAKPTKAPKPTPTSTTTSGSGGIIVKPIFPLPPLQILPSAPGNLAQTHTCAGGFNGITPIWIEDVYLTWQASAGETGYHIYKGGVVVSNIPATATQYHIKMSYNQGTGGALYNTFGVQAYNSYGGSQTPSLDVPVCP